MKKKITLITILIFLIISEIFSECSDTDPRNLWECKDTLFSIKIKQINDTLYPNNTNLKIKISIQNNSKDSIIKTIPFFAIKDIVGPLKLFEDQLSLQANEKSICNIRPKSSSEYIVDLKNLKWQKTISSIWAHKELGEFLITGCYSLVLIIEIDDLNTQHVNIGSNIIQINYTQNKTMKKKKCIEKKIAPKEN